MRYVTTIERRGRAEGEAKGRRQARQETTLEVLESRFGEVPYVVREKVLASREEAQLKRLPRLAAQTGSLAEFQTKLEPEA